MGIFAKKQPLPNGVDGLLAYAEKAAPADSERALLQAEALAPSDLRVQRALLMLGELPRRDPRNPDRHLIKCYLFHGFECPEAYDEAAQRFMARALLDHPRLRRCLALSPDPDGFLREYLIALSGQYIHMFLLGERGHLPTLFGFTLPRRVPVAMAEPAAAILRNIFLCPFLTEAEQGLIAGCFYRAYYQALSGQTGPLDEALGAVRALIQ